MKMKFAEYEAESEKYYKEMLAKFKQQARDAVKRKQAEIDRLQKLKGEHEARILRIREKTRDKKLKGVLTDQSD